MTRSEAARRIGITRAQLAALEREGLAHVERGERDVPEYAVTEVERLADLLRNGQLVVSTRTSRAPKAASSPTRETPQRDTPAATTTNDAVGDATEAVTSIAAAPATGAALTDDAEVRRLELARAIADADLRRLQSEALRDEVLRLQRDADRARRVEQLVNETTDSVLPFEREAVETILRQRLIGTADLDDGYELHALIARAIGDARTELIRQRAEADRAAADLRAATERAAAERRVSAERAAAARAADEQRVAAEQQARAQAAAQGHQRAQAIASAIAAEAAWEGVPPWATDIAGRAAWDALSRLDVVTFQDNNAAMFVARSAGQYAIAVAASMLPPPDPQPVDELSVWRRRRRRRRLR